MHTNVRAAVALVAILSPSPIYAQIPVLPPLPAPIRAYLNAALDTIQAVTIRADTVDWPLVRDSAFFFAAGAEQPSDVHGAIGWALAKANKHSFLQAVRPGAVTEMLPGRLGYVRVPFRQNNPVALADSLHGGVRKLIGEGACGWIVDLRGNGGGNMWPMLAGIGPLLGDTIVGQFSLGPSAERWFYRGGISGILRPDGGLDTATRVSVAPVAPIGRDVPVAVLFDQGTGSSGEAVAIAFLGRPNLRTFGTLSAGYATTNRGSRLPDDANMVVTVGYNADRLGREHPDQISPDVSIPSPPPGWPSPRDRVARTAAAWLMSMPECRS